MNRYFAFLVTIIFIIIYSQTAQATDIPIGTSPYCPANTTTDRYIVNTNIVFNCTAPVNINVTETSYALLINASNVVLDCNGTDIFGNSSGYGIYATGKNNITIKNCSLSKYGDGIYFSSTSNSTINNITVSRTSSYGLFMHGAITFSGGVNNTVINSTIINNYLSGIYLEEGSNHSFVDNIISNNSYYGFFIRRANNLLINKNNITQNNITGIYLEGSSSKNNITQNNISYNLFYGISFWGFVSSTRIINNTIENNTDVGIFLYYESNNNEIINNTFKNSGLFLDYSRNNTVINNTINNRPLTYLDNVKDYIVQEAGQIIAINSINITVNNMDLSYNSVGVEFINTTNSSIINNIFTKSGVYIEDSSNNNITGNVVNGKPLVYIENKSNITITNAGQIIVLNSDNVTIHDVNTSFSTVGIHLINANNSRITNTTSSYNIHEGIYILNSTNNTFNNIIADANKFIGIYLYTSSVNIINNISASNNYPDAITLEVANSSIITNSVIENNIHDGISILVSNNTLVIDNTVSKNRWGISCSFPGSYNSVIKNNIISNNTVIGVYLPCDYNIVDNNTIIYDNIYTWDIRHSLFMNNVISNSPTPALAIGQNSYNNTISNNIITNSSIYGIYLYSNKNNSVINNTIQNARNSAIYLSSVSNSTVSNNTVKNNTAQAFYLYSTNYINVTYNTVCYNGASLYNNTATNIITNNTFCAELSLPSWSEMISNLSAFISNIFFVPTSCSIRINNSIVATNSSIADNSFTSFNFTPITSEGIYTANIYCNDSTSTNYANSSAQFIIGDLSISSFSIEPSEPRTSDEILIKPVFYSTSSSSPIIRIFFDDEELIAQQIILLPGQNPLSFNIHEKPSGNHIIRVQIDTNNTYNEINENNNLAEKEIYVKIPGMPLRSPLKPSPENVSLPGNATNITNITENITANITNITNITEEQVNILSYVGSIYTNVINRTGESVKQIITTIFRPPSYICGNRVCEEDEDTLICPADCPQKITVMHLAMIAALIIALVAIGWAIKMRWMKKRKISKILKIKR